MVPTFEGAKKYIRGIISDRHESTYYYPVHIGNGEYKDLNLDPDGIHEVIASLSLEEIKSIVVKANLTNDLKDSLVAHEKEITSLETNHSNETSGILDFLGERRIGNFNELHGLHVCAHQCDCEKTLFVPKCWSKRLRKLCVYEVVGNV
jgi:hypothetical protein